MSETGRLSRNDGLIAVALGAGCTHAEVAEVAGVSERTARRRAADPNVQAASQRVRADLVGHAATKILEAIDTAIATMTGLLAADSESVRLKAACALIDRGIALHELRDVDERLAALEQTAATSDDAGWW